MNKTQFKKTIRLAFDEASEGYDLPALRFFDRSAEHLAGLLELRGGERVLDVGTGTGKVALCVARRLTTGSVTAIDLSEGMLARAQRKREIEGLERVTFRRADVDRADLPKDYFDVLTCGFGVHFWSNMEVAMARLLRSVKPGGLVAISSFAKGAFEPQAGLSLKRFTRYGVQLPTTYTWERLDSPEKNAWLYGKLGLTGFRCTAAEMGHPLTGPEQWWDLLRYTGFRAFLDRLSPADVERFKKEDLLEIAATAGPDGIRLSVPALFSLARKAA
jgi:ubiquinone/menaquinone biosynthesis C-methylase UbiE